MYKFCRLTAVLVLLLSPIVASAADRVALVIGMAKYAHVEPLKNTTNDATILSDTLTGIGFDVTTLIDAPQQDLLAELSSFAFRAETADLALIYFAGHGVEVQGENYLVPVDADVKSNKDIQRYSVSLKDLLAAVDGARKMRIVILDSCRNNPFGDVIAPVIEAANTPAPDQSAARGSGGLAPPTPDRGTLVAFAARDGQVALDGDGNDSPFALALAKKIAEPGLEISLLFRQVRDDVMAATGNQQEPHTYGSLSGIPFYMAGDAAEIANNDVTDRSLAWSNLRPEQTLQLAALAETGDTRSMMGLAYIALNPEAETFSPANAATMLTKAADAGSPEAQYELAKLFETGLGVPQDSVKALALYRQSAAQDFADAINDLGFLQYNGALGLTPDIPTALGYFERAADLKHPQAMFNYAALIDDGNVTGKSPQDAAGYLYQALRSGSQDVYKILSERPTMFSPETRRALQTKLTEVELYDGTIDGDFGPGTQRSIRKAYGLTD